MYPHERSLVKKLADKPFALLGINSDTDREEIKKTIEKEHITWRSFWNGGGTDGPISTLYFVSGWPTLYILDHKGVIRHKFVGFPGEEKFDGAIEELLKEAEAGGANQ
jgi:hypothetical protein